jgi:methyl-accepting chemotaxis protein
VAHTGAAPDLHRAAQGAGENDRLMICMDEIDATNRDVHNLLNDMEKAMAATSSQVKLDLERARAIVRDATTRLDRSFRTLHSTAAAHREVLQLVSEALCGTEGAGRSFAGSTEALLREFVDEIIRVSRDSMRIIEQLSGLSARVERIADCADAIDVLARETRFIAFNARIETHRAGDAGRTFKVVADEVKRLANASSKLSDRIRESVSECNLNVAEVSKTSTGLASHDMSRAIDSHKGLSAAVSKLDNVNRQLEEMLGDLERNMSEAVRALQFEDMVSQIVNTTIHRVERMSDFAIQALRVMERGHNGDRARPLSEIVRNLRALNQGAGIQQDSTAQGSVELF